MGAQNNGFKTMATKGTKSFKKNKKNIIKKTVKAGVKKYFKMKGFSAMSNLS